MATVNNEYYTHVTIFNHTVEPPIEDPPSKGHCMLNLSIGDIVWGPKNYRSLYVLFIENLQEEDNLSIKDKTAEFILCLLFGGLTIDHDHVNFT